MKKLLLLASIAVCTATMSCDNSPKTEKAQHTHDDGSTHDDHDTTKPVQQEFKVADTARTDTTTHTHADGEKHAH